MRAKLTVGASCVQVISIRYQFLRYVLMCTRAYLDDGTSVRFDFGYNFRLAELPGKVKFRAKIGQLKVVSKN